ncbi:MAG: hypothetical protein WAX66_00030 [Patescibacteria group bacterium]
MDEKFIVKFSKKFKGSLFSTLKTKESANQIIDFIELLLKETFSTRDFSIDTVGKIVAENYGSNIPSWFKIVEAELIKNSDIEYIREFLMEVKKLIYSAPLVIVEIPFSPSEYFIESLYKIVEKIGAYNVGENSFLLDFYIDSSIIGGAKLHIEGRYTDLTLKKVLASYLETNNVINRYL